MKKPEKHKINNKHHGCTQRDIDKIAFGRNQACDDYEAFLPDDIEIAHILSGQKGIGAYTPEQLRLAKAIAERIGK